LPLLFCILRHAESLEGIINSRKVKRKEVSQKVRTLIWVIIILVIVAVLAYLLFGRGRRRL
jgi:uncharacterized membrane protein